MKNTSVAPVRVLHIADDLSADNTGVAATVTQLAEWQAGHCEWVGVHTVGHLDVPLSSGIHSCVRRAHRLAPFWRYPAGGLRPLLALIDAYRPTHLHVHELWRAAFVTGMRAAALRQLPVVLSAHGLTAPAALANQGWRNRLKKRIYWNGFAKHFLPRLCGLHAITPLEAEHLGAFFGRPVDAVIPNAINLDNPLFRKPEENCVLSKRLVFLGRLHPIKGVDILIRAFSESNLDESWELELAGPEEVPAYVEHLHALARCSHKSSRIHFIGPRYGEAKRRLLTQAWVVAVPSHTEVVGMVNLEAASLETPTITTHPTGLWDWELGGGVLVAPVVESLRKALEDAAQWSDAERRDRGRLARNLVVEKYSLDAAGLAWLDFYRRVQRGCAKS